MTPSKTIGEHRLIAALGKGGMATVYLAVSTKQFGFTKLVVLKVMRDDLGSDEFVQMFLQEARLAARLNHANVVQTYEVGVFEGRPFLTMEYLEGQPLSKILATVGRDKLPLEFQLRVLCDTLEGLQYAHELTEYDGTPLNIIHRDVSPQNIFVLYTGQTKLLDFGIAKTTSSEQTTKGVLKGKSGYMAPEQISGEADKRCDVFAVGVMLWEAIARRRLVKAGDDEVAALTRRVAGMEEPISRVAPDTPPELAAIVDKAMATSPTDRYASARELRAALEAYLAKTTPYDVRQVAAVIEGAFADERTNVRRLIEEHMRAAPTADAGTELQTIIQPAPVSRPGLAIAEPQPQGEQGHTTGGRVFTTDAVQLPRSPLGPRLGAAAIVGIALGLGGFFALKPPSGGAPTATSAASTKPAAPSTEVRPSEPATYALTLTSEPEGARVYEGEVVVGRTPLTLTISNAAVSSEPRRLTLKREGYEPFRVDALRAASDQTRHVELIASGPAKPSGPAAVSPAGRAAGSSRPQTARPASDAPPSRVLPAPADTRGLRPLDESNPWEK